MQEPRHLHASVDPSTVQGSLLSLVLLILIGLLLPGCASITVDQLLVAANRGVSAAEENDELLIEALKKQIEIEIENINRSFDRDVDLVASGSLISPDGTPIPLDAKWVKEARMGYLLLLEGKYSKLVDLERTQIKIKGNFKTIRQLLNHARELNTLYLTNYQKIQFYLDQLESEVVDNLSNSKE